MPQGEKLVWDAFKSSLHLRDAFNHTGRLKYTWDNKRRDGSRILGRLDRHYVSSSSGSYLHLSSWNCIIKGDCSDSDHLLVAVELILQDAAVRKSSYKMNTHFLHHAEVKEVVQRIWSEERSALSTFFTRLRKFTCFY